MNSEIVNSLLITLSLLIIIGITFALGITPVYFYNEYTSEKALETALNDLNNYIQKIYGNPSEATRLIIKLPPNTWIKIYNNTIEVSKNISIILYDPNKIIKNVYMNKVEYYVNFTYIEINKQITKLYLSYDIKRNLMIIEEIT
jgi:hypothetical protein